MSGSLTHEALFGDLNLELFPENDVPSAAYEVPVEHFAAREEAVIDGLMLTSASAFLSDGEAIIPSTMPYDIPADEFANAVTMWGDDERSSSVSTTPVSLDELPEDAYPTRFTLIDPDWAPEERFS